MAGSTSNFAGVHLHVPRTVKLECDDKMIAVAALGLAAALATMDSYAPLVEEFNTPAAR